MDTQILIVLGVLLVTIVLIVTELIRIDLVALMAMLTLTWTGSISPRQALSGFSSNAIIAIIGVMIMGRGLFKSGVTERIASFILNIAGRSERRIRATISATVGVMSGFMQNIGAAALFLPVMIGISKREKIPVSNLLMPMGFAALLGGTLTMVGTSSLIVLNDLLLGNQNIEEFGLFSVTPIGIVLLIAGIGFFALFGRFVLPSGSSGKDETTEPGTNLIDVWGISDTIRTYKIQPDSPLIGKTVEEAEIGEKYQINLLRLTDEEQTDYNFWEGARFKAYQTLVIQGRSKNIEAFAEENHLKLKEEEDNLDRDSKHGYIEVVIPARSSLVGQTIRELALRETYQAQVVLYFSDSEVIEEEVPDQTIQAGDTMILHGAWDSLRYFKDSEDFITVTPFPQKEKKNPEKLWFALASFIGSIALVFLSGYPISVGFLTGAIVMILSGVMSIEEAYRAIEWKVIFLIAGLIPIGIAMEESETAAMIARHMVSLIQNLHPYLIFLALGALTTIFSLLMSNVAATVLLVPLVLSIARDLGMDPRGLVLLVGVCAANSFIIPTHHVNALLMTPGGYAVKDYLKAGSGLSVLFLLLSTFMIYMLYV